MTHRQILAVLRFELEKRHLNNPTILDVGCGDGRLLAILTALDPSHLAGFDSADYGLQAESKIGRWAPIGADLRRVGSDWSWPFPDTSFDVVVSNQVGEHVADLGLFVRENARVLRPGGFAVHVFPTCNLLIEPHMHLPIVHRIQDHDLRAWTIAKLSRLGLGIYREALRRNPKLTPVEFGQGQADYLLRHASYRTWNELASAFGDCDMRVTYRYTSMLVQRAVARLLHRRWEGRELHPILESALFPLSRAISSITLLVESADAYQPEWSHVGGGKHSEG
jgi:SAM-dependent methyltransferase